MFLPNSFGLPQQILILKLVEHEINYYLLNKKFISRGLALVALPRDDLLNDQISHS
jgi:hypothetical protein